MTLSKQFFLFVSILFLMVVSLNFMVNLNNFKHNLATESQVQTQETANALGLMLSPYMGNEMDIMLGAMIEGIFDRGYYQEIKLVNGAGKPLVMVRHDVDVTDVPHWFAALFAMPSVTASSQVNAAWNPAATVFVTTQPNHNVLKLFTWVKQALYDAIALLCIAMLVLFLLMRFVLRPFFSNNPLALSLYRQSNANGNVKVNIAFLKKRSQRDELTGLKRKSCFEKDMQQLHADNEAAFVMMIKVDGLAGLVTEQGGDGTDAFLKSFAEKLQWVIDNQVVGQITAYRLFGSEFVLLVQEMTREQVEQLAKALSDGFSALARDYQRFDIVHIGIAPFDALATTAGILAAANEAFEQAKLIGANGYYIRKNTLQAKNGAAWKALVFDIIDNNDYTVAFTGQVIDCKNATVLMEDAVTQAHAQGIAITPIGTFVAIAEKLSKIVELDRGITQKVIAYINHDAIEHAVAISLSSSTIKDPTFRRWLEKTIGQQPVAKQLVFSFSTYAVAKEMAVYKEFIEFVHALGAKVMLKRFEMQLLSLEIANALNVDYIRLPRTLSHDLVADHNKRNFVETMLGVATRLGIPMLAENVRSDQDYQFVQSLGLAGASR
ncbi:MAG: EAL domain-containing protein [Methylococcaceae bacterium]